MRKIVLLLTIIFSLFLVSNEVFAKENKEDVSDLKVMESKPEMATPAAIVQYDLAFPGTLPDSPLYKLKVLRDRIGIYLIFDPKKKIEYYLLQADKGILAAAILVDKGNTGLAAQTALKAENNYTLLTYELWKLPKKPDKELFKKLKTAALKHQEVLVGLSKRVEGDDKKTFELVRDFSKRNWETINNYLESKQPF